MNKSEKRRKKRRRKHSKLTWNQWLGRGLFLVIFGGSLFAYVAMHVYHHPDVPHILVFIFLLGGTGYLFWISRNAS